MVSSDKEEDAIDLLLSRNSPRLSEELLMDCSIDADGRPQLPDWLKDVHSSQLISFFVELIVQCPEKAKIHKSIRKESITKFNFFGYSSLTNVDALSNLTKLTDLSLTWSSSTSGLNSVDHKDVEELSGLTNLTRLQLWLCVSLTNVEELCRLTNLSSLGLWGCSSLTEDQIDKLRKALPETYIVHDQF